MAVDCVIIGAGITSLSIAMELLSRGYQVGIVAKDLPEDGLSVGFASPWAGCNWCSFADNNKREQEWDRKTYIALRKLAREHPELCEMIPFYSLDPETSPEPWFKDFVEGYAIASDKATSPGERCVTYKSYVLHAPNYLLHLASLLRARGVHFQRQRLSSLEEAYALPAFAPVKLVINASGLGAKSLLGVRDSRAIFPIRGQTVLVRAPGVKTCYMQTSSMHPPGDGEATSTLPATEAEPTYIIPRPGPEGHVVLGGSFQKDNWEYAPDYQLAERILRKNYELCPDLAGPDGKSWEDIEVVGHNVGFRPSRDTGARLDLEEITIGGSQRRTKYSPRSSFRDPQRVAVVHAYGIGPAGYQASVGYAHETCDMVDRYFSKTKTKQPGKSKL